MDSVTNWPSDFPDAHQRHWEDGERLYQAQRWANADHLYGLSAECGLKAVMAGLGMPTDSMGNPTESQYRVHVNVLWDVFLTFLEGRMARYIGLVPHTNPFRDWRVEQRYAHQKHVTREIAQAHREATDKVRLLVLRAREDGVLP